MQSPGMTPELIARYDQRIPRYTSYPTAPHFKPDISAETYACWLSELSPDKPLSLYLHVPFCAELCLYCGCHTTVTRSYGGRVIRGMPGEGDRARRAAVCRRAWTWLTSIGAAAPRPFCHRRICGASHGSGQTFAHSARCGDRGRDRSAHDHPGACGGARRLRPQPRKPWRSGFRPEGAGNNQAGAILRADARKSLPGCGMPGMTGLNLDLDVRPALSDVESVVRSVELALRLDPGPHRSLRLCPCSLDEAPSGAPARGGPARCGRACGAARGGSRRS